MFGRLNGTYLLRATGAPSRAAAGPNRTHEFCYRADYLNLEFRFTLDPCCTHQNAKCARHYTPDEDGLVQSWAEERVFMNPAYGRELPKWLRKAYEEARDNGALVVCFIPARVDTEWWHRYAAKASEIRFPIGRVKFVGADAGAPFPIAIVIFRPRL